MIGAIPLLPLHAFMAREGTTFKRAERHNGGDGELCVGQRTLAPKEESSLNQNCVLAALTSRCHR
jgi:hypothetical protein